MDRDGGGFYPKNTTQNPRQLKPPEILEKQNMCGKIKP